MLKSTLSVAETRGSANRLRGKSQKRETALQMRQRNGREKEVMPLGNFPVPS